MVKNIDPVDLFDKVAEEFEKYKNGESNEYQKEYKKVRTWCKLYKKGLSPKNKDPVINRIIEKIADDDDLLEDLLDTFYDFNTYDVDQYLDKISDLSKRLGIDELDDIIKDIEKFYKN